MTIINEYFDEFQGSMWVQPGGPNTECYPLLCADVDGIDEPQGSVSTRLCRQPDGSWKTIHHSQGSPGNITCDIATFKARQRNWLQRQAERRCPIPVYLHHSFCGRDDIFLNYDQGKLLQDAIITTKSYGNYLRGRAEPDDTAEQTEQTFSMEAGFPSPEYYKLVSTLNDADAEDEPLRDIAYCNALQCRGPCGALEDVCTDGQIVADAATGATADGYQTTDSGGTWTAWAAQPFAVNEHIASVVCFQIDRNTTRILVACGTAAVAGLRVAYSDDNGGTWTVVQVSASATDYAVHSGALFALDHRNIWLCTFEADVWFSDDAGVTWTDQGAPTPAANEALYYIHFIDENYGWAVGGYRTTPTGLFIQTTDGGDHWALATAEPATEMGVWVAVLDAYHVWVGLDDGTVYYTDDWGTTWTQRTLPVAMTNTGDGMFVDDYCGFICGYRNDGVDDHPIIYRTINGGHDWEYWIYPTAFDSSVTHFGLNAIWVCSYNEAHAVGEQLSGGNSIVWTLDVAGE